ncbi:MAG: hypothetical protein DBY34_00870 [Oscillospiraceae bacterium]|nr:MAG: hypothetical protein DBY34_00870 [Oscillospiraceae bacterium]
MMIAKLSQSVAQYLANNFEDSDEEVLAYGLELIFQEILAFIALFTVAAFLGVADLMLFSVLAYTTVRGNANGAHASTRSICLSTYVMFMFASIGISIWAKGFLTPFFWAGIACNTIVLLLYAPGDTQEKPIFGSRLRLRCKVVGLFGMWISFGCAYWMSQGYPARANVLMLSSTVACFMVTPIAYKLYGCQRYVEES